MKCDEAKKALSDYIDGNLDPGTAKGIEKHLDECAECSKEFDTMKAMLHDLSSLEKVDAPSDILEKIHERLKSRTISDKIRGLLSIPDNIRFSIEITGLAATALLVLIIFGLFLTGNDRDRPRLQGNEKLIAEKVINQDNRLGSKEEPIRLTLLLEAEDNKKPISSDKVISVNSDPTQGETPMNGIELDSFFKKRRVPAQDVSLNDIENSSITKNRDSLIQEEFISNINIILSIFEGRLLSKGYKNGSNDIEYVDLEIPADNYNSFMDRIKYLGSFETPPPDLPDTHSDNIKIRINVTL
jgi:hypothetical protein